MFSKIKAAAGRFFSSLPSLKSLPAPPAAVTTSNGRQMASEHAFEAAKRQGFKGYFYFPTLEPSDQMPQFTREETARKINWAYNNIGAIKAVIDGTALDEAGTGLWPKPTTSNPKFNRAVKDRFEAQWGKPKTFHAAGEETFYSAQFLIRRSIRMYGDMFAQFLMSGEGAPAPSMHFISMWQCSNASTNTPQDKWRDGIMSNRLNRSLKFRFVTNPEKTAYRDVSADEVHHLHDPFLNGQKRGISGLAQVARKIFSIDDIERLETAGVKLRTHHAYVIETKQSGDDSGPTLLPGTGVVEEEVQEDGSKVLVQKLTSQTGEEVAVFEPADGKTVKVVESNKTSESKSWKAELLTDVAHATLYPPKYIFGIGGMLGTEVRLEQGKVQRVIDHYRYNQLIPQFVTPAYESWLWDNIENGKFDDIEGGIPADWFRHDVICPKDMSLDPGRDGRLYDERLATGKISASHYQASLFGKDDEEVDDEIILTAIRRKKRTAELAKAEGVEITAEEIFRPPPGSAAVVASEPPPPDDKKEDE